MKYRILSAQTRILKEHITSDGEHIKKTEDEYVISEFPPNVPWAGRHNVINAASGHHISEGKWLKNPKKYLEDYINLLLTEQDGTECPDYSSRLVGR